MPLIRGLRGKRGVRVGSDGGGWRRGSSAGLGKLGWTSLGRPRRDLPARVTTAQANGRRRLLLALLSSAERATGQCWSLRRMHRVAACACPKWASRSRLLLLACRSDPPANFQFQRGRRREGAISARQGTPSNSDQRAPNMTWGRH